MEKQATLDAGHSMKSGSHNCRQTEVSETCPRLTVDTVNDSPCHMGDGVGKRKGGRVRTRKWEADAVREQKRILKEREECWPYPQLHLLMRLPFDKSSYKS